MQEIIYRLLGCPMAQFSRKIKYLSTTDCQHRDGILKPDLSDLQEGESVFLKVLLITMRKGQVKHSFHKAFDF